MATEEAIQQKRPAWDWRACIRSLFGTAAAAGNIYARLYYDDLAMRDAPSSSEAKRVITTFTALANGEDAFAGQSNTLGRHFGANLAALSRQSIACTSAVSHVKRP